MLWILILNDCDSNRSEIEVIFLHLLGKGCAWCWLRESHYILRCVCIIQGADFYGSSWWIEICQVITKINLVLVFSFRDTSKMHLISKTRSFVCEIVVASEAEMKFFEQRATSAMSKKSRCWPFFRWLSDEFSRKRLGHILNLRWPQRSTRWKHRRWFENN